MKHYPTFNDVELKEVQNDLNNVMYMLHHLDEEKFAQQEIREACFSVKVALNTLEKMIELKTKKE